MEEGKAPDSGAAMVLDGEAGDPTVEEYLQSYCDQLVEDIKQHTQKKIDELKQELRKGQEEVMALARGEKPPSMRMYTINLLVKDGPYSDGTFTLQQAENRSEFWFGRSTGKRFKESGVSLPQDLEVSTKHGKLECKDGKVYFEDVGSTNGSSINDTPLEAGRAYLISSGDLLRVGGTVLEVQLSLDEEVHGQAVGGTHEDKGDAMQVH